VHNAGSLNGGSTAEGFGVFQEQALENVTMDMMRSAFEVNTLGPLRVQQALLPQMRAPGGKVVVINTGMGSIGDNGSGGNYAYRTSKAAVNMVFKSMAANLKDKGITVASIAPGHVVSNFTGQGEEFMKKIGAKPVAQATKGILETIDGLTIESTGAFTMVPSSGEPPKPFPW
jgi:NAD(P)-dependent dehydrogenase (short-subunit alcohol dehydrogenase family)